MKRKRNGTTNRALVALREQVALINWWETDTGVAFAENYAEDKRAKGRPLGWGDNAGDSDGSIIANIENAKLDRARTYWVTSDMQALIEQAAKSMPEQPLELTDLPSLYGFIWFETPVEQLDANGRLISWRVVAWMPANSVRIPQDQQWLAPEDAVPGHTVSGRGIHLSYYTDLLNTAPGEFDPIDYRGRHWETPNWNEWFAQGNPRLMLLHENGWLFGQDYRGLAEFESVKPNLDPDTKARILDDAEFWTRRFVAATWTIMGQKLASHTRQYIPKTELRPAQAALQVQPEVIYVDLRKVVRPRDPNDPDHEPQEVIWNHRWIVDGHWRNQYLPSTGGHRLQWIHPFVKGPDDRPLIVKDRIHRVRR